MRLLQLRIDARQEAQDKIDEILDRAADDDGRDLTEPEEATLTDLRSSVERLDGQIETLQADHERSEAKLPAVSQRSERARPAARGGGSQAAVRTEPRTYSGPDGFRDFMADTFAASPFGGGISHEGAARLARHAEEVRQWADMDATRRSHIADLSGTPNPWAGGDLSVRMDDRDVRAGFGARADIETGSVPGVINPVYQPAFISRGIYQSGVTTQLLRRLPMTQYGMSIVWPRVTTKATAGIHKESAAFHEGSFETASVTAPVFEVASKLPVSNAFTERGGMSVELVQSEMQASHMEQLNVYVLFGDANTSSSSEPAGILFDGTGKTVTTVDWNESTKANRTVAAFAQQINGIIDRLWAALLRAPDAIVMGPTAWGKLRTWVDGNSRPIFGLSIATAQNPVGVADRVPGMEGPMPVGDFYGIPIFIDAWISNTFKADNSATTGGTETRVIVMNRDAVPVAYDGPMSFAYEQTLAGNGQVLLVCRGWAAFNAGWRPEGILVLGGSGTAVDA